MPSEIAITTVSWIRTPPEREIILATLKSLSTLSVPIIVVDAGSATDVQEQIKKIPFVIFFEEIGGLTKQLIKSQSEAAKIGKYLFYLQSDKLNFAKEYAPTMVKKYLGLTNKGLLIPSRTPESLKTYPAYQQTQEAFLNFFMSDYVGVSEDYYAGPKIYPSNLIKYLTFLKADIGWGIEAYFYTIAKRLNVPFEFLPCFIQSPKDIDNAESTKIYRLKITQWQIQGLTLGIDIPL